jgi:uncharacterized membrane protein
MVIVWIVVMIVMVVHVIVLVSYGVKMDDNDDGD